MKANDVYSCEPRRVPAIDDPGLLRMQRQSDLIHPLHKRLEYETCLALAEAVQYRAYVLEHLGAHDGVLVVDETGFLGRVATW